MKKWAYYNEFDPCAAAWLRELIAMGAIPKGEVDERSIADVDAKDIKDFVQCHFFAGIGGWSLALERAGVPATRPLWTGSCPCQDFSCAGKQKGFEGERDLWPAFFNLIRECRPERVFGEQVKNAVRHGWLDRLYADLETEGYACGSSVLGAHSAGADHIRQRIYWMADAKCGRCTQRDESERAVSKSDAHGANGGNGPVGGLADSEVRGLGADGRTPGNGGHPAQRDTVGGVGDAASDDQQRDSVSGTHGEGIAAGGSGGAGGVGNTSPIGPEVRVFVHGELHGQGSGEGCDLGWLGSPSQPGPQGHGRPVEERISAGRESAARHIAEAGGYARNFWSDARPHLCKDGKYRRFEPRVFPLVAKFSRRMVSGGSQGFPIDADQTDEARVMRLKGYGNAICVDTAALFIKACDEVLNGKLTETQ